MLQTIDKIGDAEIQGSKHDWWTILIFLFLGLVQCVISFKQTAAKENCNTKNPSPHDKCEGTKAPTVDKIEDALNQNAGIQVLPAVGEKKVRTTALMHLPQRFVPILLGMPVLTPRTVWKALCPVIAGEGDETQVTYKPLLSWMWVALTKSPASVANARRRPALVSPPNARINAVMIEKLKRDIPRHFHHAEPAEGASF